MASKPDVAAPSAAPIVSGGSEIVGSSAAAAAPTAGVGVTNRCDQCGLAPWRYKCPRCDNRSCSAACVAKHKSTPKRQQILEPFDEDISAAAKEDAEDEDAADTELLATGRMDESQFIERKIARIKARARTAVSGGDGPARKTVVREIEVFCDGKRARTAFVPLNEMDDMTLLSDYILLEEANRQAGQSLRDPLIPKAAANDRHHHNHNRFHQNRNSDLQSGVSGAFSSVSAPVSSVSVSHPKSNPLVSARHKMLLNQCRSIGVDLQLLPKGMQKALKNSSHFVKRESAIYWRIEWLFGAPPPQSQTKPTPPALPPALPLPAPQSESESKSAAKSDSVDSGSGDSIHFKLTADGVSDLWTWRQAISRHMFPAAAVATPTAPAPNAAPATAPDPPANRPSEPVQTVPTPTAVTAVTAVAAVAASGDGDVQMTAAPPTATATGSADTLSPPHPLQAGAAQSQASVSAESAADVKSKTVPKQRKRKAQSVAVGAGGTESAINASGSGGGGGGSGGGGGVKDAQSIAEAKFAAAHAKAQREATAAHVRTKLKPFSVGMSGSGGSGGSGGAVNSNSNSNESKLCVFMRQHLSAANAPAYHEFDLDAPIRDSLRGTTILEFPTVLVVLPSEAPFFRIRKPVEQIALRRSLIAATAQPDDTANGASAGAGADDTGSGGPDAFDRYVAAGRMHPSEIDAAAANAKSGGSSSAAAAAVPTVAGGASQPPTKRVRTDADGTTAPTVIGTAAPPVSVGSGMSDVLDVSSDVSGSGGLHAQMALASAAGSAMTVSDRPANQPITYNLSKYLPPAPPPPPPPPPHGRGRGRGRGSGRGRGRGGGGYRGAPHHRGGGFRGSSFRGGSGSGRGGGGFRGRPHS